jgi:MFS family permease
MKASSCPDIYKNTVVDEPPDDDGCVAELTKCCSLKYITIPFIIFCFSNFLLYFWYDVPYVYTIEFAENILDVPNSDSAQILSIIGVFNTIGEVLVGWLSDQPWMSSLTLYAMCMCVCGFVTAIIPFVKTYSMVLVLSGFYGFFISANYSLTSPILVDIVSIEQFSSAYGFLLACQGIGNLVGPPFAGWLYDYTNKWFLTFGLAGLFIAISGLTLVALPSVSLLKRLLYKVSSGYRAQKKTHTCQEIADHGCDAKLDEV